MKRLFDFLGDAGDYGKRIVARYDSPHLAISTAIVSDGDKPFETAVRDSRYNDGKWIIVEAYDLIAEAQRGHQKWVGIMTSQPPPAKLVDCGNAPQAQLLKSLGSKLEYPLTP